ncbi:4125_t:CDS:10 [Ambispora gerdemannii]|uniref:4125_t:CDS:1 n=1 Tax=Ambispora gerdemannii TaxID=144530 RepID=A0A9N8W648_9GLOM|nr:4125_t:CDS:10 [Ambispora gerdemannii]
MSTKTSNNTKKSKKQNEELHTQVSDKTKHVGNWLFQDQTFTITLQPITILTFLALFVSSFVAWDRHTRQIFCEIVRGELDNDRVQWIEISNNPTSLNYTLYENGAFVFKHIFLEDFKEEFDVEPLYFSEYEPRVTELLANFDLQKVLRENETEFEKNLLESIYSETELYTHFVEDIENQVKNGTYVDDGRFYARWVNDKLRYGMFASRDIENGEFLGVYCGVYSVDVEDVEYAWEYNFLTKVTDENEEFVRILIDAKYKGNYMRFANHRDDNQNAESIYIIYKNHWVVVYVARTNIKAHDQIFVSYGTAYWQDRDKMVFRTLYQINIDLITQNPQRTVLGNPNADIVNDLGGQVLRPMDTIEEKFSAPANNHIHVTVEVPAFPDTAEAPSGITKEGSSYKRTIDRFTDTTQQFANIASEKTKSLSSMNQTHLDELLKHLHFRRTTSVIIVNSTNKDFDERFVWDERTENQHAEDQKDGQGHVIKRGLSGGIRAGFELKKTVQDSDVNQAIAELIVTNIVSNHAPPIHVMLLTLLREHLSKIPLTATTTTIDSNFPIGARSNCFRHLENLQHGKVFENDGEAGPIFE